jgi:hypothetical protein
MKDDDVLHRASLSHPESGNFLWANSYGMVLFIGSDDRLKDTDGGCCVPFHAVADMIGMAWRAIFEEQLPSFAITEIAYVIRLGY